MPQHVGATAGRPLAIVTGGNSGIGFECARQLARDGWHVLLASRDRAASARAVETIAGESGPGAASEIGLDLGSLSSVRRFAADVAARDLPLRALVCNAGLQLSAGHRTSAEGHELTFAVNHLGHFLLTNLLLDRLRANAPARIVVVASGVHDPARRTGMPHPVADDLAALASTGARPRGTWDGRLAYSNSKLCNVWFTYELARRLAAADAAADGHPAITVNAFDPGLVPGSGLARDYPAALRFLWYRVLPAVATLLSPVVPTINPAWKSGRALARLVTDPALASVSGRYFPSYTRWHEGRSSAASYDTAAARALWQASERLTAAAVGDAPPAHA